MYDEADRERRTPEPVTPRTPARSPFERDRARVLHSTALRRLAAKTQVVGVGISDFPRTRLTHSLECAQIGRELGAALGADPDVVDAACLAHDLGHPPFGHNGEQALDEAAAECGGFEGNAQSLRILTRLEPKVEGVGLNLTRAVLDASTKYPWPRRDGERKYGVYADDLAAFHWVRAGAPDGLRCLEAQVMDWADDVAYSVHDLEDGVHAGHIPLHRLDAEVLVARAARDYSDRDPDALRERLAALLAEPWWLGSFDGSYYAQVALKGMASELIGRFCSAALAATRAHHGPGALRRYAAGLVVPAEVRAECALLKAITAHHVMDRAAQRAAQARERDVISELVAELGARDGRELEPWLRQMYDAAGSDASRLRVIIDQVASLTDTSAAALHSRLR